MLVTIALFAYNQEKFIRDSIISVLEQDYKPLQIIISDDCSTDKTFNIIQEEIKKYKGPHEIIINRNSENLGVGAHVNKVMEIATGEWVIGAAGDDISLKNRVSVIVDEIRKTSKSVYSVWSSAQYMDENGKLLNKYIKDSGERAGIKDFAQKGIVMGCTHGWRKDVFNFFGPLDIDVMFEDNAISFRSYLLGEILYIHTPLVHYRTHKKNLTNYTNIKKPSKLYELAAKRAYKALVGYQQRLQDLKTFEKKNTISNIDIKFLRLLILKEYIKMCHLVNLYSDYPKVKKTILKVPILVGLKYIIRLISNKHREVGNNVSSKI